MANPNFHFSASDLSAATAALGEMSEFLRHSGTSSREHKAYAVHYKEISDQLRKHSPSISANDLRHICIALTFFLEDHPLDLNASQLLRRLAPVCGFVDVP